MIPICKKGDKKEVGNHRVMTLMDSGYKIYAASLRNRMDSFPVREEKLYDTQIGFRRGRGTVDAIFTVKLLVNKEISKEEGSFLIFFADM